MSLLAALTAAAGVAPDATPIQLVRGLSGLLPLTSAWSRSLRAAKCRVVPAGM